MHPLADTGRVIAGRYRLQAPIGRGAMGVVWRARDQLLDREVAVKEVQIADTLTDAERANAYQRTLREAKTAARLNHPAVVTVYDVAEDQGRPWIVMQLVSAQSLDQVLAESGPLSPRRAADVGRQLLSALSVAHDAGVLHRDVKPSNVLLGNDDRAVLTDFGIATFAGDPRLTQTGMVMGSPGFTAPERIRGEDASPASDLWSLGATLFAAVEGRGPFERRGDAITTMSAIINEDAPPAAAAGPLGPVIAALLRREPSDRPDAATAARMITDALPLLPARTAGARAGYEATALSASSRPGPPAGPVSPASAPPGAAPPGAVPPGPVAPGWVAREPPRPVRREPAGPPGIGSGPPAPEQAAPTTPQPVMPDPVMPQPVMPQSPPRSGGLPPADFSSWYGSSSRSGSASPASPPGPAPAAWYDSPSPGSGRAAWSGTRQAPAPGRREGARRSGLWWKIAIVVLAIVGAGAGAATVILLHQKNSGQSQTGSTQGSTGALPPASLQIVDAVNKPASGALPAGFTLHSHQASSAEKAGFRIAAPSNWTASTSGHQTYLKSPSGNVQVLVDLTPHTYPNDMVAEARYIRAQALAEHHFPGYRDIQVAATPVRGTHGAFWKFTWLNDGVRQEVLDLLFTMQTPAGPQSYALYFTSPASAWDQTHPVFDEAAETFAPQA